MALANGVSPQAVAQHDARLAEIVCSMSDAVVGETIDGTVTVWNQGAEELYGYSALEMVGQRACRLYPPERRADETVVRRQLVGRNRLCAYGTERIRRDGTIIRVWVRTAPIIDCRGATSGVATMSWAAEAGPTGTPDEMVSAHVGGRVGHELRTSLNAIIGFTGTLLLRLPGPLNDEQEHQLQLVQSSAEELLTRINQLSRAAGC
jgi:PAS domain S-box-containing protein